MVRVLIYVLGRFAEFCSMPLLPCNEFCLDIHSMPVALTAVKFVIVCNENKTYKYLAVSLYKN